MVTSTRKYIFFGRLLYMYPHSLNQIIGDMAQILALGDGLLSGEPLLQTKNSTGRRWDSNSGLPNLRSCRNYNSSTSYSGDLEVASHYKCNECQTQLPRSQCSFRLSLPVHVWPTMNTAQCKPKPCQIQANCSESTAKFYWWVQPKYNQMSKTS